MLLSQAKLAIVLTCGGNQPDAFSVCHLHLSREVVSQAVDLVIHLAEKREMALVGRSHLADKLPSCSLHLAVRKSVVGVCAIQSLAPVGAGVAAMVRRSLPFTLSCFQLKFGMGVPLI